MFTPLCRELFLWTGGRDVSRKSILNCYSTNRSCMLVPGGQKEIRFTGGKGKDPNRYTLYSRHKGFVRMALQGGVSLVPVFSFGENDILHNVHLPTIQAWTYRHFGLALPLYPHGRWFSPIPSKVSIVVVFGEPLAIPKIPEPTKEDVEHYHALYFKALHKLFEESKAEAGFPNATLELV